MNLLPRLSWLLVPLVGCGFHVDGQARPDDGGSDMSRSDGPRDVAIDAGIDAPIDAAIDAPIDAAPVTTDHPSNADTFLSSDTANTNYSTQTSALADGNAVRNAVFRFDLSSLPASTTITNVELHIWTDDDFGATVTMHEVLESWTEAQATWSVRSTGTAWMTAGAEPPSRGTATIGTVNPSTTFTAFTVPIDTALVQKWANTPATNFGILIRTTDADGSRFATKEHPTVTRRPFLRITHAP